jgi:hypothetical protein
MSWEPLQPLPGTLLIGLAHVPFVWEVALQLRLAAQLYERLPAECRQRFPDAPAGPGRLFLGSARFQVAYWRYVRDDTAGDGAEIQRLKLALRRSMKRKIAATTVAFGVAVGLLVMGWRPFRADESRTRAPSTARQAPHGTSLVCPPNPIQDFA